MSRHWPGLKPERNRIFQRPGNKWAHDTGPPTPPCHEPVVQARKASPSLAILRWTLVSLSAWRMALVITRESIFLSFPFLIYFYSLPLFRAIRDPVEKHATPCASIHNIRARYILKTRPLPRYVNGRSKRETKRKTTTGRRRPISRSQIHSNYLCRVLRVHRWSCLIPPCATSNTENKARGRRAEIERERERDFKRVFVLSLWAMFEAKLKLSGKDSQL